MKTSNFIISILLTTVIGFFIFESCKLIKIDKPIVIVQPSTQGCNHDLFLYNLSASGYFTSVRVRALGSQTEFLSAGAGNGWNTSFSSLIIEWTSQSGNIPTGTPITGNFFINVKPHWMGGQNVIIEWMKNGEVICSKKMNTPCKRIDDTPYVYNFKKIENAYKEKISIKENMLVFDSYHDLQKIYNFLGNGLASAEFEELEGNKIDSLYDEPLLAHFSQSFDGFTSLYVNFTKRNSKLEEQGEYEPESGWSFRNGFLDDEENAILSKERSLMVRDKIYYFESPNKLIEFDNPRNSINLFKDYLKLGNDKLTINFIKKNREFIKVLDPFEFNLFERHKEIFPYLPIEKTDPCDGVTVTGTYIPVGSPKSCEEDDIKPEVEVVSNSCAKYSFIDNEEYGGCNCNRNWFVKKKIGLGIYNPIVGPTNMNSSTFTYEFPESDNYRILVEAECTYSDTTYTEIRDTSGNITGYKPTIVNKTDTYKGHHDLFVEVIKADVKYEQLNSCELEVQFTNKSSSNATKYLWNFPNGTPSTSISQNVKVKYNQTGNYQATLIVEDDDGCKDSTKVFVEVKDVCEPNFGISYGCKQQGQNADKFKVTFTNKSIGTSCPGTEFKWEFGDGTTKTDVVTSSGTIQNRFTHDYAAGIYTITLTMKKSSDPACIEKKTKTITIGNCLPQVEYTVCPSGDVHLSLDINVSSARWTFPTEANKAESGFPLFVEKSEKEATINFDCPDTYSGSVSIMNTTGKNDTCRCTVPYTIEILPSQIGCCETNTCKEDIAYLDNNFNSTSKSNAKYRVKYKSHLKEHKVKVKTKLQKKGFLGIFYRHKADEIGFEINSILYSVGTINNISCACVDDFNFKPNKYIKLKSGLVKKNNYAFVYETRAKQNTFKSTHFVKKGSNPIWTGDLEMIDPQDCPKCN